MQHLLARHTPTRAAGARSSRIVQDGPNVCKHALHITRTGIGLWSKNRHTFNRHNVSNAVVLYLPFYILYNFNIFNILTLGIVIPRLLNGVCTTLCLRLPEKDASVPKYVAVT
jgi:hypothetical protein